MLNFGGQEKNLPVGGNPLVGILAMITHSPEETIKYGRILAKKLKGGEVIGLSGDLGGGKTTFVKGLAQGLGIKETITSPTFVLLKEYKLRPKGHLRGGLLVHMDAYRVESENDLKSIGIEDYLVRSNVILVIEWAEKIKKYLPKNTIYIKFEFIDENKREIKIKNDFRN